MDPNAGQNPGIYIAGLAFLAVVIAVGWALKHQQAERERRQQDREYAALVKSQRDSRR